MANFPPNLVPKSVSSHPYYPKLLLLIRLAQFLSAIIGLAMFAAYLASLIGAISHANGASIGILSAAVVYTIISTLIICLVPYGSIIVKVALWIFDLAFVGGFIAVAVMTSSSYLHCGGGGSSDNSNNKRSDNGGNNNAPTTTTTTGKCNLATGTFALAIIST